MVTDELEATGETLSVPTSVVLANPGAPISMLVATFSDANEKTSAADYTASIDWGDGTGSQLGVVTGSGCEFSVSGDHTYATAGEYTAVVTIVKQVPSGDPINNTTVETETDVTASDVMAGTATPTQVLGWVVDSYLNDPNAPDVTADVDWTGATVDAQGPGGMSYQGNGVYEVDSTAYGVDGAVYAAPGEQTLDVTGTDDDGGSQTSFGASLLVAVVPLVDQTYQLTPPAATAGTALTTPTVAEFYDMNPYGKLGDYTATINWGDGTATDAGVVEEAGATGSEAYDVVGPDHTYDSGGYYQISVTVSDDGWTVVTTMDMQVSATAAPQWTVDATERQDDSATGTWLPVGEVMVSPNTGAVQLSQPLDFDQSPGTSVGGNPALVYNSATVSQPIIEVTLPPGSSTEVRRITATLTWAGVEQTQETFSTGELPGSTYVVDLPVDTAVTASGVYDWQVDLTIDLSGGGVAEASTTGESAEVVNTASAYGAGWDLAEVGRLVVVPQGVLLLDGSGGEHFFSDNGNGTYTSPPDDFGTLAQQGTGYLYTSKDQTLYNYDASGDLLSVVDRDGVTISYAYTNGLLSSVTAPDNGVTTLDYDASTGLLTQIVEPGGRTLNFTQDTAGNLTGLVDADGQTRSLGYNSHLVTSDDWAPYATTVTYADGRVSQVSLGGVQITQIAPAATTALAAAIDGSEEGLAGVTDGDGNTTQYTLEAAHGWVTQEVQPGGLTQSWTLDSAGDVLTATDADGNTTTSYYDSYGDVLFAINPNNTTEYYTYDPTFHEMTQETDANGNTTTWLIDPSNGDVLSTTDGDGNTTVDTLAAGLMQTQTDGDGNTTVYRYDTDRRLTVQQTYDASGVLKDSETFSYDRNGNPASSTVGAGGPAPETTYTDYSGNNLLLSQVDADGNATSSTYDAAGLLTSSMDGLGVLTVYAYNAAGQQTQEIDDDNTSRPETSQDAYDGAGNQTRTTDADGNYTISHFNADNNLVLSQDYDAAGHLLGQSSYTYDGNGNVLTTTDGDGNVTTNTYDSMNRVLTTIVQDAAGNVTSMLSYTYDNNGNVIATIDGDGNRTSQHVRRRRQRAE